ncbi:GPI-anchored surface protein, putative, partial [Bodo saltans]
TCRSEATLRVRERDRHSGALLSFCSALYFSRCGSLFTDDFVLKAQQTLTVCSLLFSEKVAHVSLVVKINVESEHQPNDNYRSMRPHEVLSTTNLMALIIVLGTLNCRKSIMLSSLPFSSFSCSSCTLLLPVLVCAGVSIDMTSSWSATMQRTAALVGSIVLARASHLRAAPSGMV